ncbi:MAG: hypothetical protein JSW11_07105 [Candidatus Heimdallarchaeota archaeon]|nr:MAG: hypothetical protein JSW11_07105 [Candidatus Heimdallarchaeota archaeon]
MSEYSFESYKPGYEVAQKEIGFTVTKDWVWPSAHTYQELKDELGENFDDESIIYCLFDDEIVGYTWFDLLPSEDPNVVRAWLEFPKLYPRHEQAFPSLIEHALEIMRRKGITNVRIRGSSVVKNSFNLIEKSGFKEVATMGRGIKLYYVYDLAKGPLDVNVSHVKECTSPEEFDKCAELATNWYQKPKEWVKDFLNEHYPPENLIAHLYVEDNGEIKAACNIAPNNVVKEISAFHYIYSPNELYLKPLVAKAVSICANQGYKTLVVDLINKHRQFEAFYFNLGFDKGAEMGFYEINL